MNKIKGKAFWIKGLYVILAFLFLGLILILLPLGALGVIVVLIVAVIFGIMCVKLGQFSRK